MTGPMNGHDRAAGIHDRWKICPNGHARSKGRRQNRAAMANKPGYARFGRRCTTSLAAARRSRPIPGVNLLPDAEIAEDHVQNIFDIHPARQPTQGARRGPQLFGNQIVTPPELRPGRAHKSRSHRFQRPSLALAGDQRRLAAEPTSRLASQRRKQGVEPLAGHCRNIEFMFICLSKRFIPLL